MNLLRQEIKPYFLEFSFIGLNSIKNSKRYDADTIAIKKKEQNLKRKTKYEIYGNSSRVHETNKLNEKRSLIKRWK